MGFLSMLGLEKRAATAKSSDPYLSEFFSARGNGSSAAVDLAEASGLATAHACISAISTNLAAVPLHLHRRLADGGRERATEHPLYSVLHDTPNATMTAYELREFLIASLLIRGNAYCRIDWNGRGQVEGLEPLDPTTVGVERLDSGRLRYRIMSATNGNDVLMQDQVLHLRFRLGADRVMGQSPIALARSTFNTGIAQAGHAYTQAQKGFAPQGVLSFPNPIGNEGKAAALDALAAKAADTSAKGGVLALDGGATWTSTAFSARDSEFLMSREATDYAIARIFAVPPTIVGLVRFATYSNADQEAKAMVTRCLAPLAQRVESALTAALLPREARKALFVEHDLSGMLRGDLAARFEAYAVGRTNGWLSTNEIRQFENMSRVEGGDEYLRPLNLAPTTQGEADDGDVQSD